MGVVVGMSYYDQDSACSVYSKLCTYIELLHYLPKLELAFHGRGGIGVFCL